MLERAGLTIAGAADATDLLRLTRTHRPDVVITDIRMPPRLADDGLRAAIEIRATEPGIGVIAWPSVFGERGAGTSVGRPHPGRRHPTSRAPYGAGTSSIRRKSEHSRSIADSRFSTVATTAVCVQTPAGRSPGQQQAVVDVQRIDDLLADRAEDLDGVDVGEQGAQAGGDVLPAVRRDRAAGEQS
jgi:hypothetical protein